MPESAHSHPESVSIVDERNSMYRTLISVATKFALFVILCSFLIALVLANIIGFLRSRIRRRTPRGAVLVVGTFYSRNWCRSHIGPLADAEGVQEVIAVVDGPRCDFPNVRYARLPEFCLRIFGRAVTKLLVAVFESIRCSPTLVLGYHLIPGGMTALLAARISRARAGYSLTAGPVELVGGGAASENFFLKNMITDSRLLECMTLFIVRRFDLLIVRGRKAFQYLIDKGIRRPIRIIPGGIETAEYAKPFEDRIYDVVSVCRLVEIKQPEQILHVVAELKRRHPDIRAVILGDGPMRRHLERLRERLSLTENVELPGHVEDVTAVTSRAKVFLLTSRTEGLSIAMGEAMAAGAVPVVADVGELRDLVENGRTGWCVPPGDFAAYARCISRLLKDSGLWSRCSEAARQRATACNDRESLARRWSRVLCELRTNNSERMQSSHGSAALRRVFVSAKRRAWRGASAVLPPPGVKLLERVSPLTWLGQSFRKQWNFVNEAQWWSQEQAHEYQLKQLRRICRVAYERSSYYHALFNALDFAPQDLRCPSDLRHLPIMDRTTFESQFDTLSTEPLNAPGTEYVSTGGTGGRPMRFRIGGDRSTIEYAHLVATWQRAGYSPELPLAVLRGDVVRSQSEGAPYAYDPFLRRHSFSSFHLSDANMIDYVERIRSLGPCFILAYPSTLTILARFLLRSGIEAPPNVRGLLAGSENVYPEDRRLVEEILGAPYFSWYGHSEKLLLAGECEFSSDYHIWPTYGYFELLDENGLPIATPGERGEIVGTGFINTVTPFIRYRTGDFATYVGDHCAACGRRHNLIRDVRGHRIQEMLVARDGSAIPWTALNMHDDTFDRVREFQFVQSGPGHADLRLVPGTGFNGDDSRKIQQRLAVKCAGRLTVSVVLCDFIERTKDGKCIYVRHLDRNLPHTTFLTIAQDETESSRIPQGSPT